MSFKKCGKTDHCKKWGVCGECEPVFMAKVEKKWVGMAIVKGKEDQMYGALMLRVASEEGFK